MTFPEREKLRTAFETLSSNEYNGVYGIYKIVGDFPGPTLGITVCTHGNEPAGLAAVMYVLENEAALRSKMHGSLIIVACNIKATEKYFSTTYDTEVAACRYIDINMNRLPKDFAVAESKDYEVLRARELLPILDEIDVGVDIHSTALPSSPMIIVLGAAVNSKYLPGMPIETVLSNMGNIQSGIPIAALFGRNKNGYGFGVEVGSHKDNSSLLTAVDCVNALINTVCSKNSPEFKDSRIRMEYKVVEAVRFPNESYSLVRQFETLEPICKGDLIAEGEGGPIRAQIDGNIIFASKLKPRSLNDEVCFLTERPKTLDLTS